MDDSRKNGGFLSIQQAPSAPLIPNTRSRTVPLGRSDQADDFTLAFRDLINGAVALGRRRMNTGGAVATGPDSSYMRTTRSRGC